SDGACSGNPGPGGWGAILRYRGIDKEISGGAAQTTNNRMEMTAVLQALLLLREPCEVTLCSDSKYVIDALQKGWAKGWQKNGWRKADKKPALNSDLWEQLLAAAAPHTLHFNWIKGHAGHPENERCDTLAVVQSHQFKDNL
ncbi:MAG: ribonuclease HI, partial [Pygmaiobacter sp.]